MIQFYYSSHRYTEVANNVSTQETVLSIQFVLLDCSPLKHAILGHCQEWQNKFTELLSEIATTRLKELNDFLISSADRFVSHNKKSKLCRRKGFTFCCCFLGLLSLLKPWMSSVNLWTSGANWTLENQKLRPNSLLFMISLTSSPSMKYTFLLR